MNSEISEYLQKLKHWLEKQGQIPKELSGISGEERKQLLAVNKAVEQLRRSGVSVPEDLLSLKLTLSAKDASEAESRETKIQLEKVERLIQELGEILKVARLIRGRLKATGQTGGPKRHYGITLYDLFRAGLLSNDDKFKLQWLKDGPTHEGRVKPDGTVIVRGAGEWKQYTSLSTAASKISGLSLNGWKHWRRINPDGTSTTLEEIRKRYMIEGTS
ncbi:MAG: hypothetical protein PHP23_16145 [Desulfobacterales bacterium]|nr:hypothetical protein [Desulfobacterales bacterium]MDD4072137.1 hypothetical protein [Desulfobacterales bacterium]MDD4391274.1 hypothetical protein [Desulfobacterales bacterium]